MLRLRNEVPERVKKFFVFEGPFAKKMIINNKVYNLVDNFELESYHHEWFLSMKSFELSGIELETRDEYSTVVLVTILNNFGIEYKLKKDATAFAEVTMAFKDFLRIVNLIQKLNLKLVSTHTHCSSPVVYYLLSEYATSYSIIPSYITPDQAKKVFGRKYTRYANENLTWWISDRCGMITYPRMARTNDKIFLDLAASSDRPTVEFRITKLQYEATTKRFLLFIILWYLYETRFQKDCLRRPLWKAIEVVYNIPTKQLKKISMDRLLQRIKQFEVEVLNRYTFYFHVRGRAPFKPDFLH